MENSIDMQQKPKKKGVSYQKQKLILAFIFLAPWFIGLLLFFLYPFFQSLYYSFFDIKAVAGGGLDLTFIGIDNYVNAFTKLVYKNSTFIVELGVAMQDLLINIPVMVIFSLFIAAMLNTKFRGRAIVRGIFFIPVIINSAAVTAVLSGTGVAAELIFQQGGMTGAFDLNGYLVNSGLPVGFINFITGLIDRIHSIITLSGVPILLFLSSIQSIPKHLYEAAKIEGANSYEMFWLITVPNVKPFIMTVVVFGIVDTFTTSTISNIIQTELNKQNWGITSAISWVYMICVIAILGLFALIAKIFKFGENHYE
ncbi:sugar ABC transporter permease [Acholeplasma sp. OttesenSCG-928-E16]|nr:sugar ABC transporter permease [Acholeplasma sp. OttesenSCG-928-E16]